MNAAYSDLKQKPYEGLKSYLILACYLWAVFALLVLYRSVILSEHGIPFAPHGLALVNALVLAKVILVAQKVVDKLMAMLAVVLIPFFAFTELSRALGEVELTALLFSSHLVTDSPEDAALANDEAAKIDRVRAQPQRHS
jgi:exosortase/archaeosortase